MATDAMHMNKSTGIGLGWIGIIAALIGFFFAPVWMGLAAMILGAVALSSSAKGSALVSIVLGVIVFIWPFFT